MLVAQFLNRWDRVGTLSCGTYGIPFTEYPASPVLFGEDSLQYCGARAIISGALVEPGEKAMPASRNATLCGLYLNFAALSDCVERVKSTGVRTVDMSLILPDGSLTSAISIPKNPQRLEAAMQSRGPSSPGVGAPPTVGALTKTLLMMGVPVYDSERLESKIRNGGILLSIRCDGPEAELVRDVLIQTGAQDISLGRDAKEFERCSIPRKARYTPLSANQWQQRSAHA